MQSCLLYSRVCQEIEPVESIDSTSICSGDYNVEDGKSDSENNVETTRDLS